MILWVLVVPFAGLAIIAVITGELGAALGSGLMATILVRWGYWLETGT